MRKKSSLSRLLRGLSNLLVEEADRNPEFAKRLDELLESVAGKPRVKGSRRKAEAESNMPDVYQERELRGEDEFRFWLRDQPVAMLHVIIREHDLDSARRTARWEDAEKLGAYIADRLQGRLERGSRFIRGGRPVEGSVRYTCVEKKLSFAATV